MKPPPMLSAALRLADLGLPVHWLRGPRPAAPAPHGYRDLPCTCPRRCRWIDEERWRGKKRPPHSPDAECTCEVVCLWTGAGKAPIAEGWSKVPWAAPADLRRTYRAGVNLGVHCGLVEGAAVSIVLVDLDSPAALEEARRRLPATPIRTLTSSGEHWAYRHPGGTVRYSNKAHLGGIALDIRGDGGQAVVAPSVHPLGLVYQEAEPWTAELLAAMPTFDPAWFPEERPAPAPRPPAREWSGERDQLRRRALAYAARVPGAVQGQGGSTTTFKLAGHLVHELGLTVDEAVDVMATGWNATCSPPWEIEGSQGLRRKVEEAAAKAHSFSPGRLRDAERPGRPAPPPRREPEGQVAVREAPAAPREGTPAPQPLIRPPLPMKTISGRLKRWLESLSQAHRWWNELDHKDDEDEDGNVVTKLKPSLHNLIWLLQNDPRWRGKLRMNLFNPAIDLTDDLPWPKNVIDSNPEHATWIDSDAGRLTLWFEESEYGIHPPKTVLLTALQLVAEHDGYHPVRQYLEGLRWDGRPRIADMLRDFFLIEDTEYTHCVSRYMMISAVARIYNPGCKLDYVPIFEGMQGVRKSSGIRALMHDPGWFMDSEFDIGTKDAFQVIRGKWFIELPELSTFSKADQNKAKSFLSSATDSYRPPYATVPRDFKRQCIFIGSTNDREYLKDPTGGRRYWPVRSLATKTNQVRIAQLAAMRDQLWAEAVSAYKAGERWWPDGDEDDRLFAPEQSKRYADHDWSGIIAQWMADHEGDLKRAGWFLPSSFIARTILGMTAERVSAKVSSEIASIMMRLGWSPAKRDDPWVNFKGDVWQLTVQSALVQKRGFALAVVSK